MKYQVSIHYPALIRSRRAELILNYGASRTRSWAVPVPVHPLDHSHHTTNKLLLGQREASGVNYYAFSV